MSQIVITGFMGSGKTTVAKALAQRLGYEFVDLDEAIQLAEGRPARQIIEADGESRFREIEHRVLSVTLHRAANTVIALGGGAWMAEANRKRIEESAVSSVWLDAPFALCWKRIVASGGGRPLAPNEEAALQLFNQRRSCYELADLHIAVDEQLSGADIAAEIDQALFDSEAARLSDLEDTQHDHRGIISALVGDGRPLLLFTGLSLILSGSFALFLSATNHFLPHDTQFLGMTADQLCRLQDCRIVHFMFHDRVAFGGALISVGALYMWLAEFPLRARQAWAWWAFVITGISGFGSFLAYLGYGYLDTWHGTATIFLFPLFVLALVRAFQFVQPPKGIGSLRAAAARPELRTPYGIGRALLLATALGMIAGGLTIMSVGMSWVFVPQDLEFMGLQPPQLYAISDKLVPLIAHDRAGFGGAICTTGVTVFFCVMCARPSKSLWQVLCFSGVIGFATAIGIHPVVGYNSLVHLAPAMIGALIFIVGLILTYPTMHKRADAEALRR